MTIITITGSKNSGKTFLLNRLLAEYQCKLHLSDGLISIPVFENDEKSGFDVYRILTKEKLSLCRKKVLSNLQTENYSFFKSSFDISNNLFSDIINNNTKVVFLDEIGILELRNEGWYNLINMLLSLSDLTLILSFRKNIYNNLIEKFSISPILSIDLDNTTIERSMNLILEEINKKNYNYESN